MLLHCVICELFWCAENFQEKRAVSARMDLVIEPVANSRFKVPSGTISCEGEDWEPVSPTVSIHSNEGLNEMDLTTNEDTWEDDVASLANCCIATSLKIGDKVDWEHTDWMRPDRSYAQARRREDDRRTGNKSGPKKMTDKGPKFKTLQDAFRHQFGDYAMTGASKRKAGTRV